MKRSPAARWIWALGPVALYAILIVVLSSQSDLPSFGFLFKLRQLLARSPLAGVISFDKFEHFTEYAIFGFLIARAVQILGPEGQRRARIWILATLLGAAFGATDEIHQLFVPKRDSSIWDLLADTLGTGTGAALWLALKALLRPSPRTARAPDDPTLPV